MRSRCLSFRLALSRIAAVALLCAAFCTGCLTLQGAERPEEWAQPVELEGVPGLYRVTPNLYRSGQPTPEGLNNLKALGIKTVINVRDFHSDREAVLAAGLAYERIHTRAYLPLKRDAVRFLKIVNDPRRTPVLVHCWLSSDRSGFLIAVYRIAMQGWSRDEAIREMLQGGFGFHRIFFNVPIWIRMLDIDEVKREAGLSPRAAQVD